MVYFFKLSHSTAIDRQVNWVFCDSNMLARCKVISKYPRLRLCLLVEWTSKDSCKGWRENRSYSQCTSRHRTGGSWDGAGDEIDGFTGGLTLPGGLSKLRSQCTSRHRTGKQWLVWPGKADCTEDSWCQWLPVETSPELYFIFSWNLLYIDRFAV